MTTEDVTQDLMDLLDLPEDIAKQYATGERVFKAQDFDNPPQDWQWFTDRP